MFYRFKQKWCIAFPPDEGTAELIDKYYTTSAEADTRIWQHATRILIYSPDTDVYNIGLGFTNQYPTATFIIQLNFPHSDENKYINLTSLYGVCCRTWTSIQPHARCVTLQSLFICSGCDYISYFKSIGKATFLNNFFQHAAFICGQDMPGSLHNTNQNNNINRFFHSLY